MGRRHPAPSPTKTGPAGTSSRYFEVRERDKRTILSYLGMSKCTHAKSQHNSNRNKKAEVDLVVDRVGGLANPALAFTSARAGL